MGEDNILLFARLDDLCSYADGGELKGSCFLSPRELHFSQKYLERNGKRDRYIEWGGYENAERKRIFVLPEYMDEVHSYAELSEFGYGDDISAVSVKGSGYKKLTHRDFLGSVLGLGLKREVIGDIIAKEDSALIVCDAAVAEFICGTLTKVGNDSVKVSKIELSGEFCPERQFLRLTDTVPSARLDAIVASLCSLSRTRAKEIVVAGLVELLYECEQRPDRIVDEGSTLSVKGYGKFKIISVSDLTKKGRFRLVADKYM